MTERLPRFGMTPPPARGGQPGDYEEERAQWFLEHAFFRHFVFRNPEGKHRGAELADAVVLLDDVCLISHVKAKSASKRTSDEWAAAALCDAAKQVRGSRRMLYEGHVRRLVSDTFGEIAFDRARFPSCICAVVLDCEPPSTAESAVDGLVHEDGTPIHVLSLSDFQLVCGRFDTAADLVNYFELRAEIAKSYCLRLHDERRTTRMVAERAESIMFPGRDPADPVVRRTIEMLTSTASGALAKSEEYPYSLLVDDIIAKTHDVDVAAGEHSAALQVGLQVGRELSWLNRARRIEIGRRLFDIVTKAPPSEDPLYFVRHKPSSQRTWLFLATAATGEDRHALLERYVLAAASLHPGSTVCGVATNRGVGGRSYSFGVHRGPIPDDLVGAARELAATFGPFRPSAYSPPTH